MDKKDNGINMGRRKNNAKHKHHGKPNRFHDSSYSKVKTGAKSEFRKNADSEAKYNAKAKGLASNVAEVLDMPATPAVIRRLVTCGVIPPTMFIKSLVLARDNSFLKHYGLLLLLLAASILIISGMIMFLAAKWNDIPFLVKPAIAIVLFTFMIFVTFVRSHRGEKPAVGSFSILFLLAGAVLYLSMNNEVDTVALWQFVCLWFVAITLWTFMARNVFLLLFWFMLALVSIVLWGVQEVLPRGIFSWPEFFSMASCSVALLLGVREYLFVYRKCEWIDAVFTRLVPLAVCLALALFPILAHIVGLKGAAFSSSAVILVLLVSLFFVLYYRVIPDYKALMVVLYMCCAFFLGVVAREYISYDENWYLIFITIIVAFGFSSWLSVVLKNKIGSNS